MSMTGCIPRTQAQRVAQSEQATNLLVQIPLDRGFAPL